MKLRILSVGHKMPDWVITACAEYTKRMPRDLTVEIVEIKPEKRAAGNSTENIQAIEGKRLLEAATDNFLIACDENGLQVTTLQLADKLRSWQALGKNISFLIGGADGLHPAILEKSDYNLALSQLTLPHAFARLLLCEQLYRAQTIIHNHPYHRE